MQIGASTDALTGVSSAVAGGFACHATDRSCLLVHVQNHVHISRAYGAAALAAASADLLSRINDCLVEGARAARLRGDLVLVDIGSIAPEAPDQAGAGGAEANTDWLRRLIVKLTAQAFSTGDASFHLLLSAYWLDEGCLPLCDGPNPDFDALLVDGQGMRLHCDAASADDLWALQYRRQMDLAACAIAGLAALDRENGDSPFARRTGAKVTRGDAFARSGELMLAWQPVRDMRRDGDVFYYEALSRLVDDRGQSAPPETVVTTLESLGFVRLLDLAVLSRAMRELLDDEGVVLGVNLSARSLVDDGWWDDALSFLDAHPDIAGRLIVEVTETTAIVDMDAALRLVRRLRSAGCRLAVDDFGVGHSSLQQMVALAPDIVKIAGAFTRRLAPPLGDVDQFTWLARLAEATGAAVVAEGIDSDDQADLVCAIGVPLLQGYALGRPSFGRPWRRSSNCLARPTQRSETADRKAANQPPARTIAPVPPKTQIYAGE